MNLATAVQEIVDHLNTSEIRAVADPRDLNPPAVLVTPPDLAYQFDTHGAKATWTLWCIVPDTGRRQALMNLSDLIDQVQTALGWRAVSATPDDTLLPNSASAPMYVLTFTERLP